MVVVPPVIAVAGFGLGVFVLGVASAPVTFSPRFTRLRLRFRLSLSSAIVDFLSTGNSILPNTF